MTAALNFLTTRSDDRGRPSEKALAFGLQLNS